ncbi:tRNase Z TRZ1 isoform X2 [Lingula anatina]|uniref:TRNase Z TRZ1 isoform X2 n=1 Tax=Lingula anatina TaxID=7574 RepID=A0A1S3J540_LINAN|nr:tRNase Z TRZ1 isoform X2 [Lingula anatina]|eukprot:XP_013405403.1 tRNase Z TRZ1 isoform X2 [Lingula anatina]
MLVKYTKHGHIDHIGGVPSHVRKRLMSHAKPSTYYMPEHLVQTTKQSLEIAAVQSETAELATHAYLKPVGPGESIQLPAAYVAVPFPTVHAVTSQGYIIYKQHKKLKEEFQGMESQEIASLKKQGVEVVDEELVPEIAFTGDTTFEIFEKLAHPDLLKVKVLILEATYIDKDIDKQGKTSRTKARERGHVHLQELIDNADLFKDVGSIYLMHFSDKYSSGYIWRTVKKVSLPAPLKGKLYVGNMVHDLGF